MSRRRLLVVVEVRAHFLNEGGEHGLFSEAAVIDAEGDGLRIADGHLHQRWVIGRDEVGQDSDAIAGADEGGGGFNGVAEIKIGRWAFAHEAALDGEDGHGGVGRCDRDQRHVAELGKGDAGRAGQGMVCGAEADQRGLG